MLLALETRALEMTEDINIRTYNRENACTVMADSPAKAE